MKFSEIQTSFENMRFNKRCNRKSTPLLGLFLTLLLMFSCHFQPTQEPENSLYSMAPCDPNTKHFPANENKKPKVITALKMNRDTLESLVVVPDGTYWKEMVSNMNYFDEIMTGEEFQQNIIKKGLADKIQSTSSIGLNKAYRFYRPFTILNVQKGKTKSGEEAANTYSMTLYDPKNAVVVFRSTISYNYWTDSVSAKNIMFPLFNTLIDYLNEQK